jgi:hypothetical protein
MFGWIKDFKNLKDEYILDHQSIDGYLFVRFFKMMIIMSILGCLITWPVLFPVNATGGAGQVQLDLLSMSNIQQTKTNVNRYYAHALISVVFLGQSSKHGYGEVASLTCCRNNHGHNRARILLHRKPTSSIPPIAMGCQSPFFANHFVHQCTQDPLPERTI